jgi:copper chaperone
MTTTTLTDITPDATITDYAVGGMSCEHCERAVTTEIAGISGVQAIDVSASTGTLRITSSNALNDDDVLAAVDEAGYTARRV